MPRVLLVEDSRFFAATVRERLENRLHYDVVHAPDMAQTRRILETDCDFVAALLDLHLPDAPQGEVVDLVLERGIPSIILTADYTDDARDTFWSKKIVDYVVKEGAHNLDYVVTMVERIHRNAGITVLVAEDSRLARAAICDLLRVHRFQVLEARDGQEAFRMLKQHKGVRMLITDYNMPRMDGFKLTKLARGEYGPDELVIIGVSAMGNNVLSAQFIKNGANDFLTKPFISEEFYCRVNQNLDMLHYIQTIKKFSNRDFLTGLHNRRSLFETGEKLFAGRCRGDLSLVVAMLDIDHFKSVNDTCGHETGDMVLKAVSDYLRKRFRGTDIVCRFGGEEFCILAVNMEPGEMESVFESIRADIAAMRVASQARNVSVTVSIGVCAQPLPTLEEMIREADRMLYEAKERGRDRVCLAPAFASGDAS